MVSVKLNQRQMLIIDHLKKCMEISNAQYREITGATPKTASRYLEELVEKGLLVARGNGRGTHHVLEKNDQNLKATDDRFSGQ
jgi:predicted HTH transcriptional regulator